MLNQNRHPRSTIAALLGTGFPTPPPAGLPCTGLLIQAGPRVSSRGDDGSRYFRLMGQPNILTVGRNGRQIGPRSTAFLDALLNSGNMP